MEIRTMLMGLEPEAEKVEDDMNFYPSKEANIMELIETKGSAKN